MKWKTTTLHVSIYYFYFSQQHQDLINSKENLISIFSFVSTKVLFCPWCVHEFFSTENPFLPEYQCTTCRLTAEIYSNFMLKYLQNSVRLRLYLKTLII